MDLQAAFDQGFEAVKTYVDAELGDLRQEIAELKVRPIEKGEPGEPGPAGEKGEPGDKGEPGRDVSEFVPPELAEQIKSVMQMLDEPMPIVRHHGDVTTVAVGDVDQRRVSGTMITRDGDLAVFYSDGSSERLGSVVGPPGRDGSDGAKGDDGARGDDGPPGRDGVSVTATAINRSGELMLTLSDGTVLTPGRVVARDSKRP
jgi:integrin beta 3